MNTWPDGKRRALTQCKHEQFNAANYPGTRQLCQNCGDPTGNCEEDTLRIDGHGEVCADCYDGLTADLNEILDVPKDGS